MNILILGCSFSVGFYDWDGTDEYSNHSFGYYDMLPREHNYTIYSIPGGGYLNHSTFLQCTKLLDNHEFDLCIIQETQESRSTLFKDMYNNRMIRDNITLYYRDPSLQILSNARSESGFESAKRKVENNYNVKVDASLKQWMTDMHDSDDLKCAVNSSVVMLNHLLKKHNIPAVRFQFIHNPQFDNLHTWVKDLDMPCVCDELFFEEQYHNFNDDFNGHLNYEGNKKLGIMLRDALSEYIGEHTCGMKEIKNNGTN